MIVEEIICIISKEATNKIMKRELEQAKALVDVIRLLQENFTVDNDLVDKLLRKNDED